MKQTRTLSNEPGAVQVLFGRAFLRAKQPRGRSRRVRGIKRRAGAADTSSMPKLGNVFVSVMLVLVIGSCADEGNPERATSTTETTVTRTPTTSSEMRAAEEELTAWRECMDDKIDRIDTRTQERLGEIQTRLEEIVALLENAPAALDAAETPSEQDMVFIADRQLREEYEALVTEGEELASYANDTLPDLLAARNGARAGNVDWSLCTGS